MARKFAIQALERTCALLNGSQTSGLISRRSSLLQIDLGRVSPKTRYSGVCFSRYRTLQKPSSILFKANAGRFFSIHQQQGDHRPTRWASKVGSEPGIDATSTDSRSDEAETHAKVESEIQIIDYSDKDIVQHEVTSSSLESFLRTQEKPSWAACRWIFVNGLNRDVIRDIGNSKGLHRLAVEDVLDTTTPTKVDWYESHCFMEMPLQKLVYLHEEPNKKIDPGQLHDLLRKPNFRTLSRRVGISVEQVSLFLTGDNTVVTFFEHSGRDVLQPILTRLQSPQTLVRSTNDPWMLVQAVIDAVVDLSLPIGKAVADIFADLEYAVFAAPAIAQSKEVYVLRSGLALLMDNTNAIGGLVRTLCDHRDAQVTQIPHSIEISRITRVYLQDVQDHIQTLSNSTHMSIRSAENLTSLIFNTIAASQNESVRQLTLVSSFFLPLTFLTGYFGMNFDPMPIVNNHSDAYFWLIATPVMLSTLMLLGIRSRSIRSLYWKRRR